MANKQFKVPINLVNLASDPGTASEGDVYYNTSSDTVKVYANGAWASIGSGGGSTSLDGVTDVTITSVADNEVLAYDSASSLWINQTASEAGLQKEFLGYDYEIHVSQVDGNDTTGNGDLLTPVASITKALTLVDSQRKTIIVHPGTYTESPSITTQYTTITGPGLIGGNIVVSGTISTNTGCTVSGIKMTNLTVTTPTGTGNVNILNCEVSGTFTKTSNADYTVLRLCDLNAASITGAGLVAIFGGNPNLITVNNASANVIVKSAVTVAPVLTAGTLSLVDCVVGAAVTNAVTSAASSIITLANCQFLTSALTGVAPIVLNGFYSILNCVYDKPSSTLAASSGTGGTTNSIDYFQYINADKFITQGGTSSQFVKGDGSLDTNTYATTSGNLSQFAATTSSQLLGVISDETGTGALVFGTSPTFTTSVIGGATFSAFATTDNLTIGESTGYTNVTATNNILSGGTIEGSGGTYTVTDNYSSRNLYGNGGIANYVINIGNGTFSQSGEGEVAKTINIATTSLGGIGSLNINLGSQYGFTTLYGSVSLPSTTTIAGAKFTGNILFEGSTVGDGFETTLTVIDPTADRTITLPNATGTVALTSDLSSYAALSGATFTGNIAINNSTSTALTTTGTTAALFNTTATTLNIGGAATTLSMGAATGTTTINNNLALSGAVSIAASKNIAVASYYSTTFGTGRVIMTGTGSNPATRPDGTSLVAGDIWIAY
jgi:hypothetical protein